MSTEFSAQQSAQDVADPKTTPVPRIVEISTPANGQEVTLDTNGQQVTLETISTSAVIHTAVAPVRSEPGTSARRRHFWWHRLFAGRWPLPCILVVQAALSLRLVWSATAFRDEALYLWAGHMEWSHWLYGAPLPNDFPARFSGAAVVYPPLGALADTYGGLAAARCLSLAFMLTATVLLHGVTQRIFGRRAAGMAAALFAGLGSVQYLGAFATYDAMALFMLALATWIGVRAATARSAYGFPMLALAAVALLVADASKYVAAMFDPVVITVITGLFWSIHGRRLGAAAGGLLAALPAVGIAGALAWGGHAYWLGIKASTLSRANGTWPTIGILYTSAGWVGPLLVLAVIGAVAATWTSSDWATRVMVWALAGAGFLAPVDQAHLHLYTALFKHIAYGAWFAAPVAGYALAAFVMKAVPAVKRPSALRTSLLTIGLIGISGILVVGNQFAAWPDITPVLSTLQRVAANNNGPLLAEDTPDFDYYLAPEKPWWAIIPIYNNGPYQVGIQEHRYAVIVLTLDGRSGICRISKEHGAACDHTADSTIMDAIKTYGGYRLVTTIPYTTTVFHSAIMVWVREK